jgi:hypothetical protein
MVASEASSWPSAAALRTACPGIDRGRSNLVMSAFVSTTTRSLGFVDKDFLGHPSRGRTLADAITEALKLVGVQPAEAVVFLRRESSTATSRFCRRIITGSRCAVSRRAARRFLASVADM